MTRKEMDQYIEMIDREMCKVDVDKATPEQLNWLIAVPLLGGIPFTKVTTHGVTHMARTLPDYCGEWIIGGPVMSMYLDELKKCYQHGEPTCWMGCCGEYVAFGPTELVAAMRAILKARIGLVAVVPVDIADWMIRHREG